MAALWFTLGVAAGIYLTRRWNRFRDDLRQQTPRRAHQGTIRSTRGEERRNVAERLRLRATMQHNWVLRGDPRGIYGDYRPVDLAAVPPVPRRRRGTGGLPEAQLLQ